MDAGDDPLACRDYVRQRAGLEPFKARRMSGLPRTADGKIDLNKARRQWIAGEPSCRRDHSSPAGDDARRRDLALRIWREADDNPLNTPVEVYLHNRGLRLTSEVIAADVLRFHPRCPFRTDSGRVMRLPAMLALMRDVTTNRPAAIHRTALKPDGSGKADMPDGSPATRMLGPVRGAAVKLIGDDDVTTGLGIAEGIETALAAVCAGWHPVWACGSAGAVKAFPVLSGGTP